MELYHADIRLPGGFRAPTQTVALAWSRHADFARENDRYGQIPRFEYISLAGFEVVEVGVENDKIDKILFRGFLDTERDLCIVLIPRPGAWFVKTVWANLRTDSHKTLDRSKYVS